jgi:hypothetical protein
MNKEFVTYEIASELKELGFNEPCFGYYYTLNGKDWKFIEKTEYHRLDDEMNIGSKFTLLAPLYQQVFRWFEEKYSYFVDVKTDTTPNEILGFDYYIKSWKFGPRYFNFFKEKGEGNIKVIKMMIEMVKKEKQKEALIELMDNDKDLDK